MTIATRRPTNAALDQRFDRSPASVASPSESSTAETDARAIVDEIGRDSDHVVGRELPDQPGDECRLADPARTDDHNPT